MHFSKDLKVWCVSGLASLQTVCVQSPSCETTAMQSIAFVSAQKMEFQDLVQFLQNPPTGNWGEKEIQTLLSQAYVYQTLFEGAPKHLQ